MVSIVERIAQVLVNIPTRHINKLFSYAIPEHFNYLDAGWRVLVSFGNRRTEGFIIAIEAGESAELKEILEVLDTEPWFTEHMMGVARWLSSYYLCSLGEALRLFIPGGSSIVHQVMYQAVDLSESKGMALLDNIRDDAAGVLRFIQQTGTVKHEQLVKKFGPGAVKLLRNLLQHHLITKEFSAKSRVAAQYRTQYHLAVSRERAEEVLTAMSGRPAQRRLVELLMNKIVADDKDLRELKITKPVINKLIEAGLIDSSKVRVLRDSYALPVAQEKQVRLSAEQTSALNKVVNSLTEQEFKAFLLHGITGSGKTEVYIEAAAAARKLNRQAIILVPEIALTGQIVHRFKARFGTDVTVLHSKLSLGERNDAWERMRQGEAGIVIGARSAVFAPFPDIGLIVLDEEHEFTYKQEETPRYHAREVALLRAKLAGAAVVLGSATPSVESYYRSLAAEYTLLPMPLRVSGALPAVSIVDMRDELKKGNRSVLSLVLSEMLASTISRGEQAIVLLNRRGYATFVLCRECGYVMRCEHCSVSLVYHAAGKALRCHYCQRNNRIPDHCPACKSRYIRYFGSGTQKVEDELHKLLPDARILRMDQDTTSKKFSQERILADFSSGRYDILLGTQMVAKGHDIKNVTTVGIISADTALNLPDFRAAEKTFALIMQAAGRAGRGEQPGRVVVQTYNPEHYAVQAGAKQDYQLFYNAEIAFRKSLGYPPYSSLVKITINGTNEAGTRRQAEDAAKTLQNQLAADAGTTQILGPFPAAVSKVDDVFRVNILIKTVNLANVQQALIAQGLNAQPGIIIDIDPLNAM